MDVLYKGVDTLKPYSNNNKKHSSKQIKMIADSISLFGFRNPIIIDKNNSIIAGHGRLLGAIQLGMQEVPTIVADDLTEEQVRAYRLLDNKIGDFGEYDMENILAELGDIGEFKLGFDTLNDLFGIDDPNKEEIEDEIPTIKTDPIVQVGDIFQLGNHRIMCGDSTKIEDVERLMNGQKADMVFTDPPYGMKKEKDGVANDNLNYDDLLEFNRKWIPLTFDALKDNGSWYCWGIDEPLMDIYSEILKPMQRENKITFRNLLTWDKGNGQGQLSNGFRMYPIADEKCLFVQCGIQCLTLNADQYWEEYEPIRKYLYNQRIKCGWDIPTMKTIAGHSDKSRDHWTSKSQWNLPTEDVYIKFQNWAKENNINAFEEEYDELRKEYDELRAYFDNTHDNMNNVWHFNKTSGEERESAGGHATPKPIALCSRAIKTSSRENETVLDVFGGSGSTLIACEKTNRVCYGMELSPQYIEVIIKRYYDYTEGKKNIKIINRDLDLSTITNA